jgi:hypothetical protein
MVNTECPLWWYLPTTPLRYHDALSALRSKDDSPDHLAVHLSEASQSVQQLGESTVASHPEVDQLWGQVNQTIQTLRTAQDRVWLADIKLMPWTWPSPQAQQELERLNRIALPPYRYTVELTLVAPQKTHAKSKPDDLGELSDQHLILTPAELSLITRLDYDLGRRIGDELDGQRPQASQEGPSEVTSD